MMDNNIKDLNYQIFTTTGNSGVALHWGDVGNSGIQDSPFFDAEALNKQRLQIKMDNMKKMKEFEWMMEQIRISFQNIKLVSGKRKKS